MLLATAAAKEGELRHFDTEQAFLKANVDEQIFIEIPEKHQYFRVAVRRLNKATYGLVQTGRCWNMFCRDRTLIGFEQSTVKGGSVLSSPTVCNQGPVSYTHLTLPTIA